MLEFNLRYRKISMLFEPVISRIYRILIDNKYPFGVMIIAGLTLLSCWMPWVTPHYEFGENEMGYVLLGPGETGWYGSQKLFGVTIPNWTTGCCAGVIAIFSLVRFKGIIRVPEMIPLSLALYGLLLTGTIIVGIVCQSRIQNYAGGYRHGMDYNSLGIGVIFAFVCFLFILILSHRLLRQGIPRVYNACRKSLIWPRFHSSYIQFVGMPEKRRHASIIIVLSIAAFIFCLIISYFYEHILATLGFINIIENH